jgi:hypothetical protein
LIGWWRVFSKEGGFERLIWNLGVIHKAEAASARLGFFGSDMRKKTLWIIAGLLCDLGLGPLNKLERVLFYFSEGFHGSSYMSSSGVAMTGRGRSWRSQTLR